MRSKARSLSGLFGDSPALTIKYGENSCLPSLSFTLFVASNFRNGVRSKTANLIRASSRCNALQGKIKSF